ATAHTVASALPHAHDLELAQLVPAAHDAGDLGGADVQACDYFLVVLHVAVSFGGLASGVSGSVVGSFGADHLIVEAQVNGPVAAPIGLGNSFVQEHAQLGQPLGQVIAGADAYLHHAHGGDQGELALLVHHGLAEHGLPQRIGGDVAGQPVDGTAVRVQRQAVVALGHVHGCAGGERLMELPGDHHHPRGVVIAQGHGPAFLVDVEARAVGVHHAHQGFTLARLHVEDTVHGVVHVRLGHGWNAAQALLDAVLVHLTDRRADHGARPVQHFLAHRLLINEVHAAGHVQLHADLPYGHAAPAALHEAQCGEHAACGNGLRRDPEDMLRPAHACLFTIAARAGTSLSMSPAPRVSKMSTFRPSNSRTSCSFVLTTVLARPTSRVSYSVEILGIESSCAG